ncbi:MAG: ABC transporter permease subunit [Spirochaetes bacterium]|uniref:ABC transporter permease subunit n=1 Tax=Candidatus Ornithospirochaeta stercoripullorum TaxID=2840899 RepID=A0A9D9E161_9SPIO|nr:ABC transporter permease subunit [Candidatus Ornithospirochaeta stercoripullorum]
MISTIRENKALKAGAILFWLIVWEIASLLIGEELFLPSPLRVLERLLTILPEPSFWASIFFTLRCILFGYILSIVSASALSFLSYRSALVSIILDPLVRIVRATPVASIVILVLVWVRSRYLSIVISFMMVFPIIYTNLLEGLMAVDKDLLEAADVYRIKGIKRIRYIFAPSLSPYIKSAIRTSLGLCWKSGIAAEVIGLPDGSIGERVYEAKIYLSTPDLFAWTVVIIILAFIFERFFIFLSDSVMRRIER